MRQPPWFAGTLPEWAIYWALLQHFGPDSANVVWFYQTPFASGRMFAGGSVMDFWIPMLQLGIRVQGVYWHAHAGGDKRATDLIQKAQLVGSGITIVDVSDEAALKSPRAALRKALAGESSGVGTGD